MGARATGMVLPRLRDTVVLLQVAGRASPTPDDGAGSETRRRSHRLVALFAVMLLLFGGDRRAPGLPPGARPTASSTSTGAAPARAHGRPARASRRDPRPRRHAARHHAGRRATSTSNPTLRDRSGRRGGARSRTSSGLKPGDVLQALDARRDVRLHRAPGGHGRRRRRSKRHELPGIGFLARAPSATTRRARSRRRCWGSSAWTARAGRARDRSTTRPSSRARRGSGPRSSRPAACRSPAGSDTLERAGARRQPRHHDRPPDAVPGADAPSSTRCEANGAKGGTVVVMDPHTRRRLRDGHLPVVRPERLLGRASQDAWRNRAVTDTFEPGSVNKIITAAAALETGSVSLDRTVPGARRRCRSGRS